jgi:hypothetical protein
MILPQGFLPTFQITPHSVNLNQNFDSDVSSECTTAAAAAAGEHHRE